MPTTSGAAEISAAVPTFPAIFAVNVGRRGETGPVPDVVGTAIGENVGTLPVFEGGYDVDPTILGKRRDQRANRPASRR